MLIRNPADIPSSEITDEKHWLQRRQFLRASVALAGSSLLPLTAFAEDDQKRPALIPDVGKTPYGEGLKPTSYEDITSYNNFYEFGTGKNDPEKYARHFVTEPWTIEVGGECERPGKIDIADILKSIPQEERIYRLRCVEAWAMVIPWVGFPLSALLKKFAPTSNAKYVAFQTLYDPEVMPGQRRKILDWPYREGLRIDEAMNPLTILSTGLYGRLLPNQNGAPVRLVVPWKYGFKSIKSIVKIEFVRDLPYTTWSDQAAREYGFYANVNPEVDHPRWSQKYHKNIGDGLFAAKKPTLMFNGYAEQVASMYQGMDLKKHF